MLVKSRYAFKLDEMAVRNINAKITAMKTALEEIVSMPNSEAKFDGYAIDWYPNYDKQTQEILDKSVGVTGLFLLDIGVNPDDVTRTNENQKVPSPSALGKKVQELYQDVFATVLDEVVNRYGDIGDYRTAMSNVRDDSWSSTTRAKTIIQLGLNLLLASYDALAPSRENINLYMLYDVVFRLSQGKWSLHDDVQYYLHGANHMAYKRSVDYGGFRYYEVALENPGALHLATALGEATLVIRVPLNENQLALRGAYVYAQCDHVEDSGVPVGVIGPTLTWYQLMEHVNAGNLDAWLAARQNYEGGSALIPQRMMLAWVAIAQAADPTRLTDAANFIDQQIGS